MIVIERLDRTKHNRLAFSCGKEPLDRFLQEVAHQAFTKNIAATYVAIDLEAPDRILGFYSVCNFQLHAGELPEVERKRRRLPGNLLPATLIGRLAVDKSVAGRGLGSWLLIDALARCFRAGQQIAATAIVVDALDDDFVPFYEQYGFQRCNPETKKLFIMMDTVGQLDAVRAQVDPDEQRAI